jgi:hypothetical protein
MPGGGVGRGAPGWGGRAAPPPPQPPRADAMRDGGRVRTSSGNAAAWGRPRMRPVAFPNSQRCRVSRVPEHTSRTQWRFPPRSRSRQVGAARAGGRGDRAGAGPRGGSSARATLRAAIRAPCLAQKRVRGRLAASEAAQARRQLRPPGAQTSCAAGPGIRRAPQPQPRQPRPATRSPQPATAPCPRAPAQQQPCLPSPCLRAPACAAPPRAAAWPSRPRRAAAGRPACPRRRT